MKLGQYVHLKLHMGQLAGFLHLLKMKCVCQSKKKGGGAQRAGLGGSASSTFRRLSGVVETDSPMLPSPHLSPIIDVTLGKHHTLPSASLPTGVI